MMIHSGSSARDGSGKMVLLGLCPLTVDPCCTRVHVVSLPAQLLRFQSIVPEGGATAHSSNPSMQGDFAVTTAGEWQGMSKYRGSGGTHCMTPSLVPAGKAMGSPGFQIFERYAAQVSQAEQCCSWLFGIF